MRSYVWLVECNSISVHIIKHTATHGSEGIIDSRVALRLHHVLDMLCEINSSQQVLMQAVNTCEVGTSILFDCFTSFTSTRLELCSCH